MKDKLKAVFDNRATWLLIGTVGGVFGEQVSSTINFIGNVVMAIL